MDSKRAIYYSIISMVLCILVNADQDVCPKDKVPDFYRVFTFTKDGPPSPVGKIEDAIRVLSSCGDVDEFSESMLQHFSSFGFDMSHPNLRQNPYDVYTSPKFNISFRVGEHPSLKAIIGSFYEFGEYIDSKIRVAFFLLTTNVDIDFDGGHYFPAGSMLEYAVMRVRFHGLDRCIIYKDLTPAIVTKRGNNLVIALDYALYCKDWGVGSAQGLLKIYPAENRLSVRMVCTFPPTHLN